MIDGGFFMKNFYAVLYGCMFVMFGFGAYADDASGLSVAILNAKNSCSGISDSMSGMKKMAGINTAVTGVGTVTAGVALGAGVIKSGVDETIETWEQALNNMIKKQEEENVTFYRIDYTDVQKSFNENIKSTDAIKSDIEQANEVSKKLGNIRTGTLAGTAVLDTAGTVIAANNRVDEDLQTKIDGCVKSIKELSGAKVRAKTENTANDAELAMAEKIVQSCQDWELVDLSSINKRAMGATVSGGVGAVLALTGTITSASANSNSVRNDNTDDGKQKEKNLNTASNVLAGGATAASGVATVFNATQISAIKKAADVADKCEGALN